MTENNFMNNNGENKPQQQSDLNNQMQYSQAELNDLLKYSLTYPEIYYKCMPFVMMVCDQIDTYTSGMPTQDMIDQMSDNVVEDLTQIYPDLSDYSSETKQSSTTAINQFGNRDRDYDYRRRFRRRRGPFRDFIEFLILSELFRRRRRY